MMMAGAAPLKVLRRSGVVESTARILARNRGPALLVRAGNPEGIASLEDLIQPRRPYTVESIR